jgi:hypothetical protein
MSNAKVNNLQERTTDLTQQQTENTQTLATLASQQGGEKLEKLEEELRNLPEDSETVTSFCWPDLGATFDWTTFGEWLDKGQPYEEHEEVLMFLNKNGVSNETRSDGKPSEYCSILCL